MTVVVMIHPVDQSGYVQQRGVLSEKKATLASMKQQACRQRRCFAFKPLKLGRLQYQV